MPAAFMSFARAPSLRKIDAWFLGPSLMHSFRVVAGSKTRHLTGNEAAGSTGAMEDVHTHNSPNGGEASCPHASSMRIKKVRVVRAVRLVGMRLVGVVAVVGEVVVRVTVV